MARDNQVGIEDFYKVVEGWLWG